MKTYNVYLTTHDYRGERVKIDNQAMPWPEIQHLIGQLACEYGRAIDKGDHFIFSGTYLATHGGQERHGATLHFDPIAETADV